MENTIFRNTILTIIHSIVYSAFCFIIYVIHLSSIDDFYIFVDMIGYTFFHRSTMPENLVASFPIYISLKNVTHHLQNDRFVFVVCGFEQHSSNYGSSVYAPTFTNKYLVSICNEKCVHFEENLTMRCKITAQQTCALWTSLQCCNSALCWLFLFNIYTQIQNFSIVFK